MKILWIPHAPLRSGRARAEHLIDSLSRRHEVHVFNYKAYPPRELWKYFADLAGHPTCRHASGITEIFLRRMPKLGWLNSYFLNNAISREMARSHYDIVVVSNNPYLIGYVDFKRHHSRAPIVCDIFDGGDWTDGSKSSSYERYYVRSSDSAVSVSHLMAEQARQVNSHVYRVPNGVELSRYRSFSETHSTHACKQALGIDPDTCVISIIGMTCSARLYFVDAVLALARSGRKVVLLLVGKSGMLTEIAERAREAQHVVRIEGPIAYENIMPYFMATDIGLNVVDDDPYYHRQSPLKIFEYAAMGKPVVVAPRLDEVARNGLSNVTFCEANADSLTRCLAELIDNGPQMAEPDLAAHDWKKIVTDFEEILLATRKRWLGENIATA